jgi:hypothetical protein
MQTQHKIELEVRDTTGANRPPAGGAMQASACTSLLHPRSRGACLTSVACACARLLPRPVAAAAAADVLEC